MQPSRSAAPPAFIEAESGAHVAETGTEAEAPASRVQCDAETPSEAGDRAQGGIIGVGAECGAGVGSEVEAEDVVQTLDVQHALEALLSQVVEVDTPKVNRKFSFSLPLCGHD